MACSCQGPVKSEQPELHVGRAGEVNAGITCSDCSDKTTSLIHDLLRSGQGGGELVSFDSIVKAWTQSKQLCKSFNIAPNRISGSTGRPGE